MFLYTLFTHLRVNGTHQYFSLCNLSFLSDNTDFDKKSCMKLLYIFLLSFVVGSRRLSGLL